VNIKMAVKEIGLEIEVWFALLGYELSAGSCSSATALEMRRIPWLADQVQYSQARMYSEEPASSVTSYVHDLLQTRNSCHCGGCQYVQH
jgi:hypothetical protein